MAKRKLFESSFHTEEIAGGRRGGHRRVNIRHRQRRDLKRKLCANKTSGQSKLDLMWSSKANQSSMSTTPSRAELQRTATAIDVRKMSSPHKPEMPMKRTKPWKELKGSPSRDKQHTTRTTHHMGAKTSPSTDKGNCLSKHGPTIEPRESLYGA